MHWKVARFLERGMRVPSRARSARRRRLELPSSSLARPPRFYVSQRVSHAARVSRLSGGPRLWVARRRRREKFFGERAGTPRKCIVTSGGPRRKISTRAGILSEASTRGLLPARARARPRPTARPPGTSRPRDALPDRVPTPHSPPHTARRISSTARSAGVPPRGRPVSNPRRAENAAPPSPSSFSSPSSHSSPPWCTTISTS